LTGQYILGSVGVSLKKIIATDTVNQVGRGTYQIGASAVTDAVLASESFVKNAPGKRIKPEVAKKVKTAKPVRAEVPSAKAVKAAKAAPAKKAKAPPTKKAKSAAETVATTDDVTAPTVEAEAAPRWDTTVFTTLVDGS
jgi:hypothetical protein